LQITPSSDVNAAVGAGVDILTKALVGVEHDNNLLLSTKAACDYLTYKWLYEGNLRMDVLDRLVTITNDFYDPALTNVVYMLNSYRISTLLKR
jgi:hypothetical protein